MTQSLKTTQDNWWSIEFERALNVRTIFHAYSDKGTHCIHSGFNAI